MSTDEKNITLYYLNELIDVFQNNLNAINVRGASRWSNTGWMTPDPVYYDEFEISFAVSGTRHLYFKDSEYTFLPGDLHFLDCSQTCSCENGNFTYAYFIFTIKHFKGINKKVYEKVRSCFNHLGLINRHLLKEHFIEKHFMDMSHEFLTKNDNNELLIKLIALQLLIKIQQNIHSSLTIQDFYRYTRYSGMVFDLISFLSENLDKEITLFDLGEKYKINPRYLNRVFKGITGQPIFQYQQKLKIEKAKKLLRASSLTILAIALELGFESGQYLNYIFKKVTGLTPNQYRKSLLLDEDAKGSS